MGKVFFPTVLSRRGKILIFEFDGSYEFSVTDGFPLFGCSERLGKGGNSLSLNPTVCIVFKKFGFFYTVWLLSKLRNGAKSRHFEYWKDIGYMYIQ